MHKIRTHHKHPEGRIFSWMMLFVGLGLGMVTPIFPNFVKSIVHTDRAVSVFYGAMSLLMLASALASTIVFKKIQRTLVTKISLFIMGTAFLFMIFVTNLGSLAVLEGLRVWFYLFLLMSLALFVRDFAKAGDLGGEEGTYYRFHNIGYLLGPLIGGFLATYLHYEIVFMVASIIMLCVLAYFYHKHVIEKHPSIICKKHPENLNLWKNIKEYFKNSGRRKAYLVTLTVNVWASFKYLYIPLYVALSGYIESMTGIILALSIVPLILLEVKIGEFADKKGVRLPITFGFFLMGICCLLIFADIHPLLDFVFIIAGSSGMAFVEPLQEYCLFKNLSKKEEDGLYGIYMTADPIAYFFTPLIGLFTLFFFSFNTLFLVFGILLLGMSGLSWVNFKKL